MISHKETYLTTLTPLRGIAALLVVIFHSNLMFRQFMPPGHTEFINSGWLWVDFFFVLSGFIMSYVYKDFFSERVGWSNYKKFIGARFSRVYPLHFFTTIWALIAVIIIVNKASGFEPFFAAIFNPNAAVSIQGSSQSDVIGQAPEAVFGWTNAAKNGHELANHTLFHACPEKLGWQKAIAIETYTLDKIITEIKTENAILAMLDPNRKERAFAFPCDNFLIGDTDYTTIIRKQGLVKYARTGGDSNSIITDFKNLNTMKVPSWHVWTGTTLKELIAFAEKVKKAGGMGVYTFHGIGGQVFMITSETHKAFLKYLKMHQADYWVTTFSEAVEFVSKQ